MLRPPAGLVDLVAELGRIEVHDVLRTPRLPATDASARSPAHPHQLKDRLADVALGYPCDDLRGGDVPLDPLYADVVGDDGLHPRQELRRRRLVVRNILSALPHLVDAGPCDDQQGVELQHIRTVRGIVEHLPEALEVMVRIGPGQPGHDVVADLQTVAPASRGAVADLRGAVPPLHAGQDIVVEDLHSELHAGGPQAHGALDLLVREHVRTGLHGHPDASAGCRLVDPLRLLQRIGVATVEGVEAALDEPLLILRIPACEGPAHDYEIHLPCAVADLLQLADAIGHLQPWIEGVARGPPRRRLLARVRLRRSVGDSAGTVRASSVGAVVGRRHYRHRGHSADGARGLLDEERKEERPQVLRGAGQNIGVRRDAGQTVLLAELELEVLEGIAVVDLPGPDRFDELIGEQVQRLSHTERSRPWASSALPERPRSASSRRSTTR